MQGEIAQGKALADISKAAGIERLVVSWPGGGEQVHEGLSADRLLVIRQGEAAVEVIDPDTK